MRLFVVELLQPFSKCEDENVDTILIYPPNDTKRKWASHRISTFPDWNFKLSSTVAFQYNILFFYSSSPESLLQFEILIHRTLNYSSNATQNPFHNQFNNPTK